MTMADIHWPYGLPPMGGPYIRIQIRLKGKAHRWTAHRGPPIGNGLTVPGSPDGPEASLILAKVGTPQIKCL